MKFDQLTYFREAARHEHVGRAAKLLGVTASAISHSVAALEEELGRELFERSGKNIHLTEHGRLLAERLGPILEQLEALRSDLAREELPLRCFLRIASTHQLSLELVTPAFLELQARHPQLQVELQTFRSSLVLQEVLSRQVDLGICHSPQEHPELASRTLRAGQLWIVARKGHPIHKLRAQNRVSALNRLACVMSKPSHGIQVCESHPMFAKHGIRLNSITVTDSYEVAVAAIRATNAWGLLPDWLIERSPRALAAVKLPGLWDAPYSISAIWYRRSPLPRAAGELLSAIENSPLCQPGA